MSEVPANIDDYDELNHIARGGMRDAMSVRYVMFIIECVSVWACLGWAFVVFRAALRRSSCGQKL